MHERNVGLEGVSYSKWSNRGLPELTFKPGVSDKEHRSRQAEALSLIGEGQDERARTLRDRIDLLHLLGTDTRWAWGKVTKDPVDLRCVEGLAALRHLQVSHASCLLVGAALPAGLETVHLDDVVVGTLPGSARLSNLTIDGGDLEELDLRLFPALRDLCIRGVSGRPRLIGLADSRLVTLNLQCEVELDGLPATIENLCLHGGGAELAHLSRLKTLYLATGELPALPEVALDSLTVEHATDEDLRALAPLRFVRGLTVQSMDHLRSLEGLPRTERLTLHHLPRLLRPEVPASVRTLLVQNCSITDFDGVGPLPALEEFTAYRNERLRCIGGLGVAPKLASVRVTSCKKLASVEGLGACPLTHVELYHCSQEAKLDLMPLEGVTTLERLRLTRTRVGKTVIPESLHEVVVPRSLVKRRTRTASDKPLPTQARGRARKQVAKLKKLMFSRDVDRMDQCADLVGALGSDEVAVALAGGSRLEREVPVAQLMPKSWASTLQDFAPSYDRLVPNRYFECGDQLRPYREHGLRALAAKVPEGELAGLREAEGLFLVGRSKRWERLPIRVWPLGAFPRLKRVGVFAAMGIEDLETLEECEVLEEMAFFHTDGLEDVASLCVAPHLKRLALERCGVTSLGRGRTGTLEELRIRSWYSVQLQVDPRELRGFRSLRHLSLPADSLDEEGLRALGGLPGFDSLELAGDQPRLKGLGSLALVPRLRRLEVTDWGGSLAQLRALSELEELGLQGFGRPDLRQLGQLGLRRLRFRACRHLQGFPSLSELPLEELVLDNCQKLAWTHAKALLDLPHLKRFVYSDKRVPVSLLQGLEKRGVELQSM